MQTIWAEEVPTIPQQVTGGQQERGNMLGGDPRSCRDGDYHLHLNLFGL